jgi:epoxyqueuosine reductase
MGSGGAAHAAGALTAEAVKAQARAAGFDLCGVAPAEAWPELQALERWLALGYAGDMHYLHRTAARRADVRAVLPSARSVVMLAVVYNTDRPYSVERADPGEARIARYAWGDDYHDVLGARLRGLVAWMAEAAGPGFEAKAYVDTGPIQERVYAQYAGLGWIGKNTCLVHPSLGSWLVLAAIACNWPLEPDPPGFDQCGTCTLCLEACPTGALVAPRVLDARRCLSYLTIESRGAVPEALRPALGAHVFGCDICQDVCPYNLTPATGRSTDRAWQPRPALDGARLVALWRRSDGEWRELLKGSALRRAGLRGLRRNLAVALGNHGGREAADALDGPADAPSAEDPLVAEHVAWARRRLGGRTDDRQERIDP